VKIVKKRKLFGVLNLLDVLIILFVLAIVIPALHYYIKFNEKGFVEQKTLERYLRQIKRGEVAFLSKDKAAMEVDVSFKNLTEEDVEKIKVGDKEIFPDGTVVAEVLQVGQPQNDYRIIKIENFETVLEEYRCVELDNGLYALKARMKLRGFVEGKLFYYKSHAVIPYTRLPFKADDYVVGFYVEGYPYGKIKSFGRIK